MTTEHPDDARIGAFIDGELAESERRAVAAHLETCPSCAAEANELRALSRHIAAAGSVSVPPGLRGRIQAALAAEAAAPSRESQPLPRPRRTAPAWLAQLRASAVPLAASLLVTALLSSGATWWAVQAMNPGGGETETALVMHDVLTAHLRALAQDGAVQVASSDSHTVKPWFAGKVDFSPNAPDLSSAGFPLVGGRLDIVDGKRVGALVYRRRLHLIDVFVWPAATQADTAPTARTEHGYNIVTWNRGGVTYSAVSDVEIGELKRLAALL